jgi:polyisoprenyl-teichoic acid--peptidoglycan teichoic acid transferase
LNRYKKKIKKRRRIRWKRIFLISGLISLGIVIYSGYLLFTTLDAASQSFKDLERGDKSKLREEAVTVDQDPFSVLIMGVEDYSTGGYNGRTDSLMVVTLNPDSQTVKLLSIPRDTLVDIPNKIEKDKINHAYAYGGKDATIESVENLLDIPIDYYVTVGFQGFKDIINELGGVTVDVPFDFNEKSDEDSKLIYFKEGNMSLTGEEALAYARMRKQDPRGDFGRNDRQKQILQAAVDKMFSPTILTKLDDIAKHIGENVQTNMKISDALKIQSKYKNFTSSNIEKLSLSGNDQYLDGIYYYIADEDQLNKLKLVLQDHLSQETDFTYTNKKEKLPN